MLVIPAGNEAVHWNDAIIAKGPHGRGGGIHDRLVARSAANNHCLNASFLQHWLKLAAIEFIESGWKNDRLVISLFEGVRHPRLGCALVTIGDGVNDEHIRLPRAVEELRHGVDQFVTGLLGIFAATVQIQNEQGRCFRINGNLLGYRFVRHVDFPFFRVS